MLRVTKLLLSFVVLALIFSFSVYSPFPNESTINNLYELGPNTLALSDDSGDDDDDDDDDDDGENEDDADPFILYSFFDLRDRESYVQVTNVGTINQVMHVQIFNVDDNCNENNFYDVYTPGDTHIYNIRDILTNDGNPSGVVIPDNSYGAVIISTVTAVGGVIEIDSPIVGNIRMLDNNGYEYRTNIPGKSAASINVPPLNPIPGGNVYTFNYNTEAGVILSDIFGITPTQDFPGAQEVQMSDPTAANNLLEVDIYNLTEVPFSCRNVLFACIDQDNPRLQETLEEEGAAVASFEYGINEAIPSSKGAPLLCPSNINSDGLVSMAQLDKDGNGNFVVYVGLNNGNGRGSIDSIWGPNRFVMPDN